MLDCEDDLQIFTDEVIEAITLLKDDKARYIKSTKSNYSMMTR